MRLGHLWLLSMALCFSAQNTYALDSVIAPKAARSLALDIARLNEQHYLAVGERGHILLSNDDGKTWQQKVAPTRATLTSIAQTKEHLLVGGHDGILLLSSDKGETWKLVREQPDEEKPVLDVLFLDDKLGFAVGAYGLFLKTTDGGYRWLTQDHPELEIPDFGFPHLYQMQRLNDGTLVVIGEAGFIARSTDAGDTWTRIALPYEGTLFALGQTSSGVLVVAGMRGNIFRSEDLGATWENIDVDIRSGLNHMIFEHDQLLIGGMDGMLLVSDASAKDFRVVQRANRKAVSASAFLDNQQALVAAEDGVHIVSLQSTVKE